MVILRIQVAECLVAKVDTFDFEGAVPGLASSKRLVKIIGTWVSRCCNHSHGGPYTTLSSWSHCRLLPRDIRPRDPGKYSVINVLRWHLWQPRQQQHKQGVITGTCWLIVRVGNLKQDERPPEGWSDMKQAHRYTKSGTCYYTRRRMKYIVLALFKRLYRQYAGVEIIPLCKVVGISLPSFYSSWNMGSGNCCLLSNHMSWMIKS